MKEVIREGKKEIIVEGKVEKRLKPMSQITLEVEQKLSELDISPDGKIQGVRPITSGANGTLPPNSGYKKIGEINLIIAPQGKDAIVVVGEI